MAHRVGLLPRINCGRYWGHSGHVAKPCCPVGATRMTHLCHSMNYFAVMHNATSPTTTR